MKIYVQNKGVILVGKAWEIKNALSKYNHSFHTVAEWTAAVSKSPYKQ